MLLHAAYAAADAADVDNTLISRSTITTRRGFRRFEMIDADEMIIYFERLPPFELLLPPADAMPLIF